MDSLIRRLWDLGPDALVKIGTVNGSGWFYIGTAHEFEKELTKYDNMVRALWKTKVKNAKDNISTMLTATSTIDGYVRSAVKKHTEMLSLDGYLQHLDYCFKRINKLKKRAERLESILENLVPLRKRKIIEYFAADEVVDMGYTCIKIEGYESGAYWDSKEADILPAIKFDIERTRNGEPDEETEDAAETTVA